MADEAYVRQVTTETLATRSVAIGSRQVVAETLATRSTNLRARQVVVEVLYLPHRPSTFMPGWVW